MDSKRKRKNYFSNQGNDPKRRKRLALEIGMKGFLCTCNFREKDCVREAYNLLNEYADKIYGTEEKKPKTIDDEKKIEENINAEEDKTIKDDNNVKEENEKINDSGKEISLQKDEKESEMQQLESTEDKEKEEEIDSENDEEDISTALNKELNELKAEAVKPPSEKKFQVVDTGVSNVIFVKTTISDPLPLVIEIVKDLYETKKQKCRYLLRMLPIQVACKPYLDDIKSKADVLFEKYFSQEPKTFCIVFNRHSNSNLHRTEVIEDLAQIISKKNPGNKANLKNPDIAVVVEVIRSICLLSIAPNYFTYKKFNLLEICNRK